MSRFTRKHKHQAVIALDHLYLPMVEISRRKALKACATGRAHILDLATWAAVPLQDAAGRPFQVVVFPRAKAVSETRLGTGRGFAAVHRRDGHRCQYDDCTARGDTLDHVVPRAQGGRSTYQNLVSCCSACNSRKGDRTPEQAGMKLKRPIRSPRAVLMERLQTLAEASRTA